MDQPEYTKEIIGTVEEMNRCWTGRWDDAKFRQFIHPDAVAIAPTMPGRLEGKDAIVAGWKSFADNAVIHEWTEYDHHVKFCCRTTCAIVTYLFSIIFTTGGQKQTMKGRDMMVLIKKGGRWLVIADQFSPEPVLG